MRAQGAPHGFREERVRGEVAAAAAAGEKSSLVVLREGMWLWQRSREEQMQQAGDRGWWMADAKLELTDFT